MSKNYEFPAIDCKEGSAWHEWSKEGAIFAYENQNADYEKEANDFANNYGAFGSAAYLTRKRAFLKGTTQTRELKRLNP